MYQELEFLEVQGFKVWFVIFQLAGLLTDFLINGPPDNGVFWSFLTNGLCNFMTNKPSYFLTRGSSVF